MKVRASYVILVSLMLLALLTASTPVSVGASAPPPPQFAAQVALSALQQAAGDTLTVEWGDTPGGPPSFVSGIIPHDESGQEQAAREFFSRYGKLYGMRDQAQELALVRTESDDLAMQHVRFTQTVNGVPVFGGQMIVHLRGDHITAVNGEYFPNLQVDTSPSLTQSEALAIVRADVADDVAEFRADRSGLVVYVDEGQPYLAWKINLFSWNNLGNWLYFVDAENGQVIHKLNQLDTAKSVKVYTANNGTPIPGTLVCGTGTGNPACTSTGDADVEGAYANSSKTYDYYLNAFGRDSYDGLGTELVSTVHYSSNYHNAFWNGYQMVYGDGDSYARAFDVVAHELTHGVTQETDGLIYEHQPGALNESWSDAMAVFAGCSTYTGMADCDWLMGETLSGGAIRSMSNPTTYGQPDHWDDYEWLPLESDNGGVHTNNGIPNKAAYLLTNGGAFHSVPVTGIGFTKVEQIYYRTMEHYLTTYSGFYDARFSLYAACQDKIGTYGITQTDCESVLDAWAAVGIGSPASASPGSERVYIPITMRFYPLMCSTSDIVKNGGFEGGFSSWATSGSPGVTGDIQRSGSVSALLGHGNYQNDRLTQSVTVPADAPYMQLTFYVGVASEDSPSTPFDYLYLTILDSSGSPVSPEYWIADNTYGDGYYSHAYAWWKITLTYNEIQERNLQVRIRATTDSSLYTAFFVDDVSWVTTCTRHGFGPQDNPLQQPFELEVTPVDGSPSLISGEFN